MKKFQIKQKCEKMTKWREKFTGLRWMNWVECSLSCTFRQWKPPSQIVLSSFWSMVLNKKTNEWLYFVLRKRCQVSCVERVRDFDVFCLTLFEKRNFFKLYIVATSSIWKKNEFNLKLREVLKLYYLKVFVIYSIKQYYFSIFRYWLNECLNSLILKRKVIFEISE
jgi:hypothetical protein